MGTEREEMDKGFITLYRKMTEWEWYDDLPTFRLFICLLFLVNWEDKKWHGETIKRGQLITSIGHLSEDSGLSIKQVRRALDNLLSTEEIMVETTNKYTKITVKNYSKYQDKGKQKTSHKADNKGNAEETDNEQGKQRANKGQTKGKQRATTKPLKPLKPLNNKESRKKFMPPSVDEVHSYCQERNNKIDPQAFVDFYSSKGWMVGKNKMKDWKACVRTWERREKKDNTGANGVKIETNRDTSLDDVFRR